MEFLKGLVNNYSGLLACRFFLGLIEGLDIPEYLSLYSSVAQAVCCLELFSISLSSILGRGCKYGMHQVGVGVSYLTYFSGLRFSLCLHHWREPSPVCWPLPST